MPLLSKILENKQLKQVRTRIFDVFDHEYCAIDNGPGKESWATKRCLEKIFEHQKVKSRFGF